MALPARPYPSLSPAPWAEVVPDHGPATVDELLTLPDDGYIYEVVEGALVRLAGSGDEATGLGLDLGAELRAYVRPRRLGRVTGADGVYRFPGAETGLVPDVGFYLAERRAQIQDRTKPIPFAPDLALEVASPSQTSAQMATKARIYLRAGTRLVWVVLAAEYPRQRVACRRAYWTGARPDHERQPGWRGCDPGILLPGGRALPGSVSAGARGVAVPAHTSCAGRWTILCCAC